MVCITVPMETQASFAPEEKLRKQYADPTSEPSQQLIESITHEVKIIHMYIFCVAICLSEYCQAYYYNLSDLKLFFLAVYIIFLSSDFTYYKLKATDLFTT